MRKQIGATSPTPVSPTSILPTYYILVPFHLLMQSVTSLDYPWQVAITLAYMEGGIVGISLDYLWMVGGWVDIPGLSVDGPRVGGHPWTICGWSGIQGYSDMEWEG